MEVDRLHGPLQQGPARGIRQKIRTYFIYNVTHFPCPLGKYKLWAIIEQLFWDTLLPDGMVGENVAGPVDVVRVLVPRELSQGSSIPPICNLSKQSLNNVNHM